MSGECGCGRCATCAGAHASRERAAVADALFFRHGSIKARMLGGISGIEIGTERPLDRLGTRETDDPTVALIDAFAGSLHVLASNAAYLSDDGSIRRATERDALLDLTRLLGYAPRPALAATTTLSFMLDDLDASARVARIPMGTKVASVPGQDEIPQTFETDTELEARAEWNRLRPVIALTRQVINAATGSIVITGAGTPAKVGDQVLVYAQAKDTGKAGPSWLLARVRGVARDPNPLPPGLVGAPLEPRTTLALAEQRLVDQAPSLASAEGCVIILGQRAVPFGATAPDQKIVDKEATTDWPLTMGGEGTVDLDAVYPDAVAGRAVLFSRPSSQLLHFPGIPRTSHPPLVNLGSIESATDISRADYALSAKVTRLVPADINFEPPVPGLVGGVALDVSFLDHVRDTSIAIETARETLFREEKRYALPGRSGTELAPLLDRLTVSGNVVLPVGRRLVLSGEDFNNPGKTISETVTLVAAVANARTHTTKLVFSAGIANRYVSVTLGIYGNSVDASQAETPVQGAELIGSGDATRANQRFQLKGSPLAYVPASNARGYAPALDVRVGDRPYGERNTVFGATSEDRAYAVRAVRDGKFEIQFAGRLPTGTLNASALYRTGGGQLGNLAAGRITTAMTPVVGVNRVVNLVPASGGSDAETIEQMRLAAPQSVKALERAVSLADFESFARGYRGVGKVLATELRHAMRAIVFLTIATTELTPPGSDLIDSLGVEIAKAAVPGRVIRIGGFVDLAAGLTIGLAVDRAFRRADVEATVRTALTRKFGRPSRNFGEALLRSAVLAAIQGVEGVVAATLPGFTIVGGGPPESEGRLLCPVPTIDAAGQVQRGGLLSVGPISFTEMPI